MNTQEGRALEVRRTIAVIIPHTPYFRWGSWTPDAQRAKTRVQAEGQHSFSFKIG